MDRRVFTRDKIQYTDPITYNIKDFSNDKITWSFHKPELKAKEEKKCGSNRYSRWYTVFRCLKIMPKIMPKTLQNVVQSKWHQWKASKKKNERTVYFTLCGDMEKSLSKAKLKLGDKVRLSRCKRRIFDKGHTRKWTEECLLEIKFNTLIQSLTI